MPILGQIESILDFRSDQIERLKATGAVDAQAILESMIATIRMRGEAKATHEKLIESTKALLEDEPLLPK